jgi:hypothetical protein
MDNQEQAPTLNESIQEVQGIFPSDAALQDAVGRLTRAGFDRAAISLPAANPPAAEAENPVTEDDTRQARTLGSSMAATAGAMVGAGVVVATGGAAVAAVAAAAGLGLVAGGAAHTAAPTVQDDARDAAAAAGELVLSATAHDPDAVLKATAAMQAAGATRVATVSRTGGALD